MYIKKNSHKIFALIISILFSNMLLFSQERKHDGMLDDLLLAVSNKDKQSVRNFINQDNAKIFINEANENGENALILAAKNGDVEIVNILLYAGASTDIAADNGMTALMYAVSYGYIDIVRSLLAQNANPNMRINSGPTALIQASALGYYSIVEMLLDAGANPQMYGRFISDDSTVVYDITPLMIASYNNHYFICNLLVENGAFLDPLNEYGNNALLYAVGMGNDKIIEKSIDDGINIDILGNFNTYKNITPLALAALLGNYPMSEKLLEHTYNIDKKMYEGKTALIWAVIGENEDIVEAIINKGASVDEKDSEGKTPLIYAAEIGNTKIVDILIANDAKIDILDSSSRNALSYAMENGNAEIIKILSQKMLDNKSKK